MNVDEPRRVEGRINWFTQRVMLATVFQPGSCIFQDCLSVRLAPEITE